MATKWQLVFYGETRSSHTYFTVVPHFSYGDASSIAKDYGTPWSDDNNIIQIGFTPEFAMTIDYEWHKGNDAATRWLHESFQIEHSDWEPVIQNGEYFTFSKDWFDVVIGDQ